MMIRLAILLLCLQLVSVLGKSANESVVTVSKVKQCCRITFQLEAVCADSIPVQAEMKDHDKFTPHDSVRTINMTVEKRSDNEQHMIRHTIRGCAKDSLLEGVHGEVYLVISYKCRPEDRRKYRKLPEGSKHFGGPESCVNNAEFVVANPVFLN